MIMTDCYWHTAEFSNAIFVAGKRAFVSVAIQIPASACSGTSAG